MPAGGNADGAERGVGPLDGRGGLALRAHARFERLTGGNVRLPFADHDNGANRFVLL